MCSNENDRNVDSRLSQLALKLDSTQPRHAHIEHEAGRPFGSRVLQEFPGGSKGLDFQSGCSKKTLGGTTNRQIVINNKYDGLGLGHGAVLPASGRLNKKVAPGPWFGSAHNRPPCDSMIMREMAKPMPMPWGFVV